MLLTEKETTVTKFKCNGLANCDLRNSVIRFFNCLKHYKHFSPHFSTFGLCDMCPFHSHTVLGFGSFLIPSVTNVWSTAAVGLIK
jgi:hypothetical protein